MHTRCASIHGFTLTELLIVLAIAGILAMIGAPAMGSLLARTRVASAEGSIVVSLRHARTQAVMHNTRVIVCPSHDGRHCRAGDDWQRGWIVAKDADHDSQPDTDTAVIAALPPMPPGTRVITSRGRRQLSFHPNGSAAGSNATFTVCHARERSGSSIVVSNTGRVRIDKPEPEWLQQCLAGLQ